MFKQHGAMSAQKRSKYGVSMVRRGGLAALFALACGVGLSHAQGVLNVGLVPAEDPRLVVSENQALLDHLHNALQLEIKPFVATDYNGVIEALRAKKLDLALLGPFSYVLAVSVADVDAFAMPETQKQGASYRARDHRAQGPQHRARSRTSRARPSPSSTRVPPRAICFPRPR